MELMQSLRLIGLKQSEIEVYLALLKTGEVSIGKLSEVAKIHKKNIYEAAKGLVQQGLVSSMVKGGVTYWSAQEPQKLLAVVEERKNQIEQTIPFLEGIFNSEQNKRQVTVYDGVEGLRSFHNDILQENKPLKVVAGTGKVFDKLKFYAYPWFKKMNKKIEVLFNHDANIEELKKEAKNLDYVFLPKEFTTPTQFFIYGEKTGIVVMSENPLAIVIENEEITKGFEKYYEFLRSISKKSEKSSRRKKE